MERLRLSGAGKRYGRASPWVLNAVDLALGPGALVRVEGANGSGKSTLLKLVAGIEPPSRGRVQVAGRRAYVPERFPPALPFDPAGYLRHLGRIQGLSTARAAERAEFWLDRFGIADRAGTPLRRLSKGTCQKVAVAQALLAEAEVLLLDEAWTGLDQAARSALDEAAVEQAAAGATVLFVDHDPTRLAGHATAAHRVEKGELMEVQLPPPDGPQELVSIRVALAELPERLPGAPSWRREPDGTVLLRVGAEHSDALLRRLLTGATAVRVLDVRTAAGLPEVRSAGERG
ncbi:ABC transporter ATP-binding protein [Kitasatospora kifunensis]|uniref:ABC-type multidrug transport system ATPase subunit n=1 Tax=Kitasatospora kifunensis TaxID=58351 RepID=A0A7W7R203_KITKI|nr:ATP-binding cassette domain-containing protein [Kitasatospora kifunensis]MBB4923950.1 ABC-type multidrug transport system ATPase subunit [Kitasatospora kifunensis]